MPEKVNSTKKPVTKPSSKNAVPTAPRTRVHERELHEQSLVKSHVEPVVKDACAYCGAPFADKEITIEKEIHGRVWRFCSQQCYQDFMHAVHFQDEDLDSYDNVIVGKEDDD